MFVSLRAYRLSLLRLRRKAKLSESTVCLSSCHRLPDPRSCHADRISITSAEFAQKLHELIAPHLPSFPYPASVRKPNAGTDAPERKPSSLNSNIRMYKYSAGQYFGPHYDDSVRDPATGDKSEWTLLIYLTGIEDGVEGGEVCGPGSVHMHSLNVNPDPVLSATTRQTAGSHHPSLEPRNSSFAPVRTPPTTYNHNRSTSDVVSIGSHGHECLLHEGSPVLKGTKYILRSDLMFKS